LQSDGGWLEKLGVSFDDFLDPEKASCVPFDPSANGVELCAPYIADGAQGKNVPFHVNVPSPLTPLTLIAPPTLLPLPPSFKHLQCTCHLAHQ
jgi:hypothetical protein